ncbi:sensor histidine kinase [Actinoplanes sp. G11-F43]|uniref:sensor histidine kinase n=1 Tax=Actinoplanes sp. G11-F43 TaxID=3424130 RepID=UPI003D33123C
MAATTVPAGYDVAVLVALAAVVTHSRSTRAVGLSGVTVLAGTVIGVLIRIPDDWGGDVLDYPHLAEHVAILGAGGAVWLIAYVLRANRERADGAERERDHLARLAAADERAFIARELHDVVAHSLAVMIAQADGATYVLDSDTERARDAMRTVAGTGREALADMHRIVAVLRGTGDTVPERRLGQFDGVVEGARAAGLGVGLRVDGDTGRLSPAVDLTVLRLVQESLTNVLRHAGPGATVTVSLTVGEDSVRLEIADDGHGRVSVPADSGGNGLLGMRERVAVHHGEFSAGPRPDAGWLVRAMIPLTDDKD